MIQTGFGSSDITPRLGVQLAGYGPYRNRAAREIIAPLRARAMVLTDRRRCAVVLSVELCGVPRELAARLQAAVAKRIGCRPKEVMVSVTHTHSSPSVGGMFGWGEADAMYVETLPARAAEAAVEAWQSRAELAWRHAEVPCEGIAVNRETDAGFALAANFADRMDPAWRPDHPEHTDPTVRVLAAWSGNRPVGMLHHFGCHPVVYGEKTAAIHGDFVGLASAHVERTYPGSVAMFLPGALGDINPKLNHRVPTESRRALHAIARQYGKALRHGLKVGRHLEMDTFQSIRRDEVFARQAWSRGKIDQRIAELEACFDTVGISDHPHTGGEPPLQTLGMERARLEGLRAVRSQFRGERAPNPPVCLHGLQLGPVAILGCGLEPYHRLQAPVLKGSPHVHTWIVGLVGGVGYAPDRAAHERAGYAGDFVPLICGELPFRCVHHELPRALISLAKAL
ncbi:neutral/alkaline non-lysosomal ceramidase N-terminal domain-containing protein [Synoicihabitans lomoniglobus]|uniref:Neutral/alkaline non-lysosomal ceramidase N-terminal domain-containing protein n=1 Tax=Synoicihabitans lomoniglobus TaxID=2909285 RepID=A0AAF0I1K9_9BACT|nr:neutral/alkaline non-lysosomal ceramidase N-terminal domain-containing protein [Opitutaceae bacterium LMO-M01]WED65847.1 neutral/alkaline non-lysosomal ceramidase N-terminal domain-containing protein [Opitutaceae bacterium LMO-M01]